MNQFQKKKCHIFNVFIILYILVTELENTLCVYYTAITCGKGVYKPIVTCRMRWMMAGRAMKLDMLFNTFMVSSFSAEYTKYTHTRTHTELIFIQ